MPRPSPTVSATLHAPGDSLRGNDGNVWVVQPTKSGVHRWVRKQTESSPTTRPSSQRERPPSSRNTRKTRKTRNTRNHQKTQHTTSSFNTSSFNTPPPDHTCADVVQYTYNIPTGNWLTGPRQTIHHVVGRKAPRGIYKFIRYNEFESSPTPLPKGARKINLAPDVIQSTYCGSRIRLRPRNDAYRALCQTHRGEKVYTTHDNGGRPFVVYVSKLHATVYRQPQHSFTEESDWSVSDKQNRWAYTQRVVQFSIQHCYVGKSPLTPTTRCSGGHGKAFDGNTLLFDIGHGSYAYVGEAVFTFSLMPGDRFQAYYSAVGNNDVPYPVLRGHTHVYFLLPNDRIAVPLSKWVFRSASLSSSGTNSHTRWADAYGDYYAMKKEMDAHCVPIQEVHVIQTRLAC